MDATQSRAPHYDTETGEPLDGFAPGVVVIVHGSRARTFAKIERVTKSQVEVAGYGKFRRKPGSMTHGMKVGAGEWSTIRIALPKPGEIKAIKSERERARLALNLRGVMWEQFSLSMLREMKHALQWRRADIDPACMI